MTKFSEISDSFKLRAIVLYMAVVTTIAVFGVGYNQYNSCATAKANNKTTNERIASLDIVISEQVKLYKVVRDTQGVSSKLATTLNESIDTLETSRDDIQEVSPETAKCFLVGAVNSGNFIPNA